MGPSSRIFDAGAPATLQITQRGTRVARPPLPIGRTLLSPENGHITVLESATAAMDWLGGMPRHARREALGIRDDFTPRVGSETR